MAGNALQIQPNERTRIGQCGTVTGIRDFCPSTAGGVACVDDLLAVINGWGPCPGTCPAYCWPDVTQNSFVNIDDLLYVINHWGACNAGGQQAQAPRDLTECYERTRDRYPNTTSQQFADAYEACVESLCRRGLLPDCP